MRDAGSAAKKIFPELAQVSLFAGYKHREGLGQDEEWGGAGGDGEFPFLVLTLFFLPRNPQAMNTLV